MRLRPRFRARPPARRRTAGLVLGLLLLASSSVLGLLAGRQQAVGQLDAALSSSATEQVTVTDEYFERARSIVLLLAQNPVFSWHFGGTGGDAHEGMNDALAFVESLYPGRIGEACVID
ncbi:MAG: hypothetical protein M3P96_09890 [Actinomycetota bacterium]|nr:hypothetical protein [Actinomycetota bacterium]